MSKTRKRAHMLKKKVLQAGTSLGTSKPDKDRGDHHHHHHHHHERFHHRDHHGHPCRQKYSEVLSPPFSPYQTFLNYLLNNGHRPQASTWWPRWWWSSKSYIIYSEKQSRLANQMKLVNLMELVKLVKLLKCKYTHFHRLFWEKVFKIENWEKWLRKNSKTAMIWTDVVHIWHIKRTTFFNVNLTCQK